MIDIARRTPLTPVQSTAVSKLGFVPGERMVLVVFTGNDTVYGYPNLADDEIRELVAVMEQHESLGRFISTVIKPSHDHERIQF